MDWHNFKNIIFCVTVPIGTDTASDNDWNEKFSTIF